jgi:hypothetical protein
MTREHQTTRENKNTLPVPLSPAQISHTLAWDRTQASVVTEENPFPRT